MNKSPQSLTSINNLKLRTILVEVELLIIVITWIDRYKNFNTRFPLKFTVTFWQIFRSLISMVAIGFFQVIIALLAAVSSASIQRRQEANVITSCTTPNTVALTFVSVFLPFFQSPFNAFDPRTMDHISTCKEICCFTGTTLILESHCTLI